MIFEIEALVEKHGNDDGEMLNNLIFNEFNPYDGQSKVSRKKWAKFDMHDVLFSIVQDFILPKLTPEITVYFMSTIHNPVRLEPGTVGIDMILSPADIEVADMIILERARMFFDKQP